MRLRWRWIFFSVCGLLLIYFLVVKFFENQIEIDQNQSSKSEISLDSFYQKEKDDESVRNEGQDLQSDEKKDVDEKDNEEANNLNYNVHTFYYPWYGNPMFDNGSYFHWNHNVMPGPGDNGRLKLKRYEPPDDIGANFYPELGCYSSRDPAVIKQHFEWIRNAGIGTVVVSWYPPSQSTDQGHSWDDLMTPILDAAQKEGLKIAFHIEPYKDRNVENLRVNLNYIISRYGQHPAFYRHQRSGRRIREQSKPLFYIYDSYLISDVDWRTLLRREGRQTVRNTALDSYFIGLLVSDHHKTTLASSGFDGIYTYFAATGFSYGSTWQNWRAISVAARRLNMIFIPCVGPGYIDECVRPWNKKNTLSRNNGAYFNSSWQAAISARPNLVGVTSFNEWHEGTQIEPAIPKVTTTRTYLDYKPLPADSYLKFNFDWVKKFGDASKDKRNET